MKIGKHGRKSRVLYKETYNFQNAYIHNLLLYKSATVLLESNSV